MSKTTDKAIEAMNEGVQLNVVRQQHGYHWRVYHGTDLVCKGTNPHKTQEAAEAEARRYFCEAWEVI